MKVLLPVLLLACSALVGLGVLLLFVGVSGDTGDAASLARFSRASERLTYHSRYEAVDSSNPDELFWIEFDRDPAHGKLRIAFDEPLVPPGDRFDPPEPILKSGDILIVNDELPEGFVSCRTERQSCRTADGLERLALVSFLTLFDFNPALSETPQTVSRVQDVTVLGEHGACFIVIRQSQVEGEFETPKTVCYAANGLPLGGLVSDSPPNSNWLNAVELRREVDAAAFDAPFPIVPSVYDSTPVTAVPTP